MGTTDPPNQYGMARGGERRRYLTILFSDLSDSTNLATAMEHEDYAALLAELAGVYEQVIRKHGGTLVQMQGDGILAIFGYPAAGENDGRRATEAALDLHDIVRSPGFAGPLARWASFRLHSGIHSGLVLLDEGDPVRGRFGLHGNAANIAVRLSDAAGKDEILVSATTLGAESHFFQTGEQRTLRLQGVAEPISVCRILARASIGTRFEARVKRGLLPFVGRQAELEILDRNLRDTIAGTPRYVALSAPPGLGKTRLAEEFLRRAAASGCQIHRGYCESYLSAEPLQPFLQMLRALCWLSNGTTSALAAEVLERALFGIDPGLLIHRTVLARALSLTDPTRGEGEAKSLEDNIVVAMQEIFAALAGKQPLVIFIDDWQWADDATRKVLRGIRSLDQRPIFVLVATRESGASDVGMSNADIIHIAPFARSEAEEVIGRLLPGMDPFVMTEIRKYAGGNPLFIEELCHSAAHENAHGKTGRAFRGAVWLNKLIESRVERLPEAEAELVRTAAVIGNVIPLWLLESTTGCGEHDPLVRELAERDFIFPGESAGTLRFKHGITRDVIYDSVGLRSRREMHLRIAEALRGLGSMGSDEEFYEALAYHYGAGGHAAEAARYAELAGDKATAVSALDRAQIQYEAALNALDLLEPSDAKYERWMSIAQRLGMACVFDPSRDRLPVLRRAIEFAAEHDDRQAMAAAEYWVGYVSYALGQSRNAIHHLERALASARAVGDEALLARVRATLGQANAAACDYDTALTLLDDVIARRRQRGKSSRPATGFAYTLTCKAAVLADYGLFDKAHECFEEALTYVGDTGHEVEGSILLWRSAVYLWQGRWDEAHDAALQAQRIGERVRSLYHYARSLSHAGYAAWNKDRTAAPMRLVEEATSWLAARDKNLFISLNYGWLAEGMAASGRWKEARHYAACALNCGRGRDRLGGAMACRAMARGSAAFSPERAERYLALAMSNARARSSRHEVAATQLCAAEINLSRGSRAKAAALLGEAEATFDALGMVWHRDEALKLRQNF